MELRTLIAGHIDLTQEEFNTHYVPDIEAMLEEAKNKGYGKFTFYIGGAKGTDEFAQDFIHSLGHKIVICDKGEQNNAKYDDVEHKNGFGSYPERDAYMVNNTNAMVVFLRKTPRSLGSGSFHSLVTKSISRVVADAFQTHARAKEYDSITDCIKEFDQRTVYLTQLSEQVLVI